MEGGGIGTWQVPPRRQVTTVTGGEGKSGEQVKGRFKTPRTAAAAAASLGAIPGVVMMEA